MILLLRRPSLLALLMLILGKPPWEQVVKSLNSSLGSLLDASYANLGFFLRITSDLVFAIRGVDFELLGFDLGLSQLRIF